MANNLRFFNCFFFFQNKNKLQISDKKYQIEKKNIKSILFNFDFSRSHGVFSETIFSEKNSQCYFLKHQIGFFLNFLMREIAF